MKGARSVPGSTQQALRMALALAGLAAGQALAQADSATWQGVALGPRTDETARLEVATSNLPRNDRVEGFSASQRVDFTLMPPKDSAVGLAFGMQGYGAPVSPIGAGLAPGSAPSVDVGVHWRHTLDSNYRIGVTAYRRMPQQTVDALALGADREPAYGARVEVDLNRRQKDKASWADKGLLGVQLDNGGRVSLRRKHGGPMVYYRNTS
jgi:hypothetical protein